MNPKIKRAVSIVFGALLIMAAAFINEFPIIYSDTSTYLGSGFRLETPFDRPITYGLFLRLSSLNGASLWLVIFTQSLILSFLIYKVLEICLPHRKKINLIFLLTLLFLSFLSSASWNASQLISDIFTPIMLLSLVLLLIGNWSKKMLFFFYFIFVLATSMHMSHITFNVVLILSLLILRKIKAFKLDKTIKFQPLIICLALSLASILTMGSAVSKSKHAFLMGALVEHGIAKAYLDDNCKDKDYQFCAYKDSLPAMAWQFLWVKSSPFHKMGAWKETKEEFNEIILNTLTTPKYIFLHLKESFKATIDQLSKFKITKVNDPFIQGTLLHKKIGLYFEYELNSYESSVQSRGKLICPDWYNQLLSFIVYLSLCILLFLFFRVRSMSPKVVVLILIVIMGILINAWACGTLANAIDRLGCKMIWLLPFAAIVGLVHLKTNAKVKSALSIKEKQEEKTNRT